MNINRTIKLLLNISPEPFQETAKLYTKAYNDICSLGFKNSICNGITLHHLTYPDIKKYLPSQLAISSRCKAAESLKSVRELRKKKKTISCPQSSHMSIRYDMRSYTISLNKGEVSLLTTNGRDKTTFNLPEYCKQYIDWKTCSADLIISKSKKVYLHVVLFKQIEDPIFNGKIVGVDRGVKRLAVTSNNQFFSGGHIKQISKRYSDLRGKLQSVGSKSAKRHLRAIGSKENRFRKDVNHCVSKQIVSNLEAGNIIVLEDLTNIRTTTKHRKAQRKEFHKWNFYELEQFIKYKAEWKRCFVEYVSPAYTSQRCSVCGHIEKSNRKNQSQFVCKSCGFQLNADLNASRNIRNKYQDSKGYLDRVAINQPIVADLLGALPPD